MNSSYTPAAPTIRSPHHGRHAANPDGQSSRLTGATCAKRLCLDGQSLWAGTHWNPVFVYPQPAKDVEGAVFTVVHGPHTVLWVNTIFDVAAGRMQYVAVIPEVMTFTVDVRLTPAAAALTHVKVTYTRTALDVSANDTVLAMGKRDGDEGPEWQRSIESFLKSGNVSACTQG